MKLLWATILTIVSVCNAQQPGPLSGIATLQPGVESERASSWDHSGGNADNISVPAGGTARLAEIRGAGEIRHIWIASNASSPNQLRELVLRMYWDGESNPSVEVPLGDFFGTGFANEDIPAGHSGQAYHSWHSLPFAVSGNALNCYLPMPFGKRAQITITNDGANEATGLYYQIDYVKYPDESATASQGRFHAQWHHQLTKAIVAPPGTEPKNLDGQNNYIFMHAKVLDNSLGSFWPYRAIQQDGGVREMTCFSLTVRRTLPRSTGRGWRTTSEAA